MSRHTFTVRAVWDGEAQVYYSESDIDGLYIEAATLEDFKTAVFDLAPDLIAANHLPAASLQPERPTKEWVKDWIPTIVLDRTRMAAAIP